MSVTASSIEGNNKPPQPSRERKPRAQKPRPARASKWLAEHKDTVMQAAKSLRLAIDTEAITSAGQPLQARCTVHPKTGVLTIPRASLLLGATRSPCPDCQQSALDKKAWASWRQDPDLYASVCAIKRKGKYWAQDGGYLYRIRDKSSPRVYIGITRLSVEVRWQNHLLHAGKTKRPLYEEMGARPEDFSIEPIAFFQTRADLAAAEKEWIASENSFWPNGYNRTRGGEVYARKTNRTLIDYALVADLSPNQIAHLINWKEWGPALDLTWATLVLRMRNREPYESLTSRRAQRGRPVTLGGVSWLTTQLAEEALGLGNASSRASAAKVTIEEFLQFSYRLQTDLGPWSFERWTFPTLDEMRASMLVSTPRLMLCLKAHPSATICDAIVELGRGERVCLSGVTYLSKNQACTELGIKFPTVIGHTNRTGLSFEAAVAECLLRVSRRKGPRRVVKQVVDFTFRGVPYSSPTLAAREFGIADNTFSYWRGKYPDPEEALTQALAHREQRWGSETATPEQGPIGVTFRGVAYPSLKAACAALELSPSGLAYWVKKYPNIEDAITQAIASRGQRSALTRRGGKRAAVEFRGVSYPSLTHAAKGLGMAPKALGHWRKKHANPVTVLEQALACKETRGTEAWHAARYPAKFSFRGQMYTSPTAAAAAFGVTTSSLSRWCKTIPDRAEALEAILAHYAAEGRPGAVRVVIRGVEYATKEAACSALELTRSGVQMMGARNGLTFEEAVIRCLENRESSFVFDGVEYASFSAAAKAYRVPELAFKRWRMKFADPAAALTHAIAYLTKHGRLLPEDASSPRVPG